MAKMKVKQNILKVYYILQENWWFAKTKIVSLQYECLAHVKWNTAQEWHKRWAGRIWKYTAEDIILFEARLQLTKDQPTWPKWHL